MDDAGYIRGLRVRVPCELLTREREREVSRPFVSAAGPRFPQTGGYRCEGTVFTFEPALIPGEDVLVTIFNRTHALVRLRQGKAWAKDAGSPLKVTAISSGPMGPFPGFSPTVVAVVAPDDDHSSHDSGMQVPRRRAETSRRLVLRAPRGAGASDNSVESRRRRGCRADSPRRRRLRLFLLARGGPPSFLTDRVCAPPSRHRRARGTSAARGGLRRETFSSISWPSG